MARVVIHNAQVLATGTAYSGPDGQNRTELGS
jgi:hypothetical protein